MSTSRGRRAAVFAGAVVVGLLAAVLIADAATEETDAANARLVPTREDDVRRVPVLSSEPTATLSEGIGLVGVGAPEDDGVRSWLGTWGAVSTDADVDEPDADEQVDDGRLLGVALGPVYTDPCIDGPDGGGCPDRAEVDTAVVEGDPPLEPNAVVVHAFPRPDAELAAECPFDGLAADELAIAVATANPGTVEVKVGGQTHTDVAAAEEVAEFDEWRSTGDVRRLPSSFVAHCLAVPRPTSAGPARIRVAAIDEAGQLATAETIVLPSAPGMPGVAVTPIDDTMVRIEVPLRATGDADVFAVPVGQTPPDPPACPLDAPERGPAWRRGSSTLVEEATGASAPYLREAPRLRRVTLALPEAEPSLLCVDPVGIETSPVALVVTPPDARRLTLAVAEVGAPDGTGGEDLVVRGTFPFLGWTPCRADLGIVPSGTADEASTGRLCSSGGDTGAISAAGGVLDLEVGAGDAVHVVRIALSAEPGGESLESYVIPIPASGLEGVLCTDGVDQPDCVAPEGDAVLGSVTVTAAWDEGPTGPSVWTITPAP